MSGPSTPPIGGAMNAASAEKCAIMAHVRSSAERRSASEARRPENRKVSRLVLCAMLAAQDRRLRASPHVVIVCEVRQRQDDIQSSPRTAARNRALRGLRHRLTWWGEGANPIVLLHGWGDTGETWQFLVDCLPEDWSFVALDWRGFGGSEWAEQGYWFPDYFADLEAFLDAVCPNAPARVIAHSMGGNIASMYGGMRPERIEWLVNLEGIGLRRNAAGRRRLSATSSGSTSSGHLPASGAIQHLEVLVNFLLARNPACRARAPSGWLRNGARRIARGAQDCSSRSIRAIATSILCCSSGRSSKRSGGASRSGASRAGRRI